MKQTINISGMTCEACEYKIQHIFSQIPSVKSVIAKHSDNSVTIESDEKISQETISEVLKPHSKYELIRIANPLQLDSGLQIPNRKITDLEIDKSDMQSWISQYYPLLLIVGFITVVSFLTS